MFNIRKSFSDIQFQTRSTFPFFNAFNVRSVALSDKTFILHSLFAHCSLIVQLDDNILRLITINTCSLLFLCPTVNRLSSTLKRWSDANINLIFQMWVIYKRIQIKFEFSFGPMIFDRIIPFELKINGKFLVTAL